MKTYRYPSATISRLRKQNKKLLEAKMTLQVCLWDSKSAAKTIQEISDQILLNCEQMADDCIKESKKVEKQSKQPNHYSKRRSPNSPKEERKHLRKKIGSRLRILKYASRPPKPRSKSYEIQRSRTRRLGRHRVCPRLIWRLYGKDERA